MNSDVLSTTRIAGLLLMLSPLLLLLGVILIAIQGKLTGMAAGFGAIGSQAEDASGLRIIARFAIPSQIAQIAGFALFSVLLYEAGDRGLSLAGLSLVVLSAAVAAVEGTFQSSLTVWAVQHASEGKAIPELFEPLRRWVNGEVQLTYMSAFLTGMLLFSISAVRTGILSSGIGWLALASSVLAFPIYFFLLGAPLIIIIFPLIFGVGLLVGG